MSRRQTRPEPGGDPASGGAGGEARARALRLLGLGARAGTVVPGTDRVREDARAGRVRFVLLAADASPNAREKLEPLLARRGIPYFVGYQRWELGAAVGRGPLSALGVRDDSLAAGVRRLLEAGGPDAEGVASKPEGSDPGERR